jgi:L-seryl-tRNA(Ser) seleniumtransferase
VPWEFEEAINEHTAAMHYDFAGYMNRPHRSLRLEQVLQICHRRGVPVILDIAGELPPAENLTKFPAMGVDLTIFSGGKGLMGPQSAGLILGRRDLIEAVTLNGNPYFGIGRSMKVDKEAMVGMVRAVELYMTRDHEADQQRWAAQVRYLVEHLSGIDGFQVFSEPACPHGRPVPQVYINWDQKALGMRVEQAVAYLASMDPSVWVSQHLHYLRINPHMMPEGDEVIMAEMVREFLEGAAGGSIFIPPSEREWLPLSATRPHIV